MKKISVILVALVSILSFNRAFAVWVTVINYMPDPVNVNVSFTPDSTYFKTTPIPETGINIASSATQDIIPFEVQYADSNCSLSVGVDITISDQSISNTATIALNGPLQMSEACAIGGWNPNITFLTKAANFDALIYTASGGGAYPSHMIIRVLPKGLVSSPDNYTTKQINIKIHGNNGGFA